MEIGKRCQRITATVSQPPVSDVTHNVTWMPNEGFTTWQYFLVQARAECLFLQQVGCVRLPLLRLFAGKPLVRCMRRKSKDTGSNYVWPSSEISPWPSIRFMHQGRIPIPTRSNQSLIAPTGHRRMTPLAGHFLHDSHTSRSILVGVPPESPYLVCLSGNFAYCSLAIAFFAARPTKWAHRFILGRLSSSLSCLCSSSDVL